MKTSNKRPFAMWAGTAALLASGAASAQSSVTVFGVVDAAVSGFSNTSRDPGEATPVNPFYVNRGSVKVSTTVLRHSGTSTSRLGFRGTEDLGGGLAASFWLEAPITNDDGATGISTFARRSTVSLSGAFGELRIGRDYTPTFWNDSVFDPWAQIGAGSSLNLAAGNASPGNGFAANANYARASNSVGYFLPQGLGGFYGQAMYAFHENTKYDPGTATPPGVNAAGALNSGAVAATRAGRYVGGRLGYANGPLDIALAYARSTLADSYYAGTTDQANIFNLGASYDFGPVKLSAEMSRTRYEREYANAPSAARVPGVNMNGYLLAVSAPVGPGLIRAAYSRVDYDLNPPASPFASTARPRASKIALGYVHNLSKRTALYATVARVSDRNGATLTVNGAPAFYANAAFAPRSSTGYDLGIRHAF